jgi:hypothetical protein
MMLLSSMLLQVFFCCQPLQFDVAVIHPDAGVFSVASPTVTSVHALLFTQALSESHALASVSATVGSTVAGVVAL